jgi:predicted permease
VLRATGAPILPQLASIGVDARSIGFAIAASLTTGVIAALLPALLSWRVSAAACLRTGSAPPGRGRTRNVLVVLEVALAVVLATGAGLLVRSVDALWAVDPGFAWRGVSKVEVTLPTARYREPAQQGHVVARLEGALRSVPGVDAAGVIAPLPLSGGFDRVGFEVDGRPRPEGQELEADRYVVTPGGLEALGLGASIGRLLDARDAADAAPAVLVSETLARRVWPGASPLGQRIRLPWNPGREDKPWRTVVGVVRDLRQYGLDGEPTAQLYLPHVQYPVAFLTFVARAGADRGRVPPSSALDQAVREVDADLAPFDGAPLESVLAESIGLRRLVMALLAAFAGLAVLLAGLGLNGVVGQVVAERSREVGVRIALGARPAHVARVVLAAGLVPTAVGIALGLAGAVASVGIGHRLLYGISPYDPVTFALVPLALAGVAAIACLPPTRRAVRTDPLGALKQD